MNFKLIVLISTSIISNVFASPGLDIVLDSLFFKSGDTIEMKLMVNYGDKFDSKKEYNYVKNCFDGELIFFLSENKIPSSEKCSVPCQCWKMDKTLNKKIKPTSLKPAKGGYDVLVKSKSPVSVNNFCKMVINIDICGAWDKAVIKNINGNFHLETRSAPGKERSIIIKNK